MFYSRAMALVIQCIFCIRELFSQIRTKIKSGGNVQFTRLEYFNQLIYNLPAVIFLHPPRGGKDPSVERRPPFDSV